MVITIGSVMPPIRHFKSGFMLLTSKAILSNGAVSLSIIIYC